METLNTLNNSVKKDLASHIIDKINNGILDNTNKDDWHHYAFNEDYFIIGYHQANQWLKKHDIDTFEAIGICQEFEKDNFGEIYKVYDNSETTVNMLTYILGEELIYSEDFKSVKKLKKAMKKLI
jgi:hypothetical protein